MGKHMSGSGEGASKPRETRASILSALRFSKDIEQQRRGQGRFFQQYQPRLAAFFHQRGVSAHEAEDLASDLVLDLFTKLGTTFKYDPSKHFGAYLSTCARRAVADFGTKRKHDEKCRKELAYLFRNRERSIRAELETAIQNQIKLDLLDEAMERARHENKKRRNGERDWEIFIQRWNKVPSNKIAASLGMGRGAVDEVNRRMKKLVKRVLLKLEQQGLAEEDR